MVRRAFAGGNTPKGFVSFFDHIMPLRTAKKRYFLKGASGSGKSTFMKKIADAYEAAGFDTELFHCANDAGSLDGMAVMEKGFCIVDGTAPHACDPEIPASIDRIIDFAGFLDEQPITLHESELKALLNHKKILNEKAQGYFTAAANVYLADKAACEAALSKQSIHGLARKWVQPLEGFGTSNCAGADRKLFLSAVTPDGVISYADEVLSGYKTYGLCTEAGAGINAYLADLRDEANMRGINTESFYSPFEPSLEYLLMPDVGIAFAVTGSPYGYLGSVEEEISFSRLFDTNRLCTAKTGMERNSELFNMLMGETCGLMKASRGLHSKIEDIYISAMDFDRVNELTDRIIRELLSFDS